LRWNERHYVCPDHGALQVHEEDLLHRALYVGGRKPRTVIMAKRVRADGTASYNQCRTQLQTSSGDCREDRAV
jgi:hypothetical protein